MKLSTATQRTNDALVRALWTVICFAALTSAVLGAKMVFNIRKVNALNLQSSNMEKQLLSGTPAARPEDGPSLPHGYATLRVLQAEVTDSAKKHSCQLTEFKSGTNVVPFISKYRKDAPVGAWSQLDAKFTIVRQASRPQRNVAEPQRCSTSGRDR